MVKKSVFSVALMRYQVDTADSGFITFKIPKAGANPVN
jgi:hypothetical protein